MALAASAAGLVEVLERAEVSLKAMATQMAVRHEFGLPFYPGCFCLEAKVGAFKQQLFVELVGSKALLAHRCNHEVGR